MIMFIDLIIIFDVREFDDCDILCEKKHAHTLRDELIVRFVSHLRHLDCDLILTQSDW